MAVRYYATQSGRMPAYEFIRELPRETAAEVLTAIEMLNEGKVLSMPLSRPMSGINPRLHELRFRDAAGQVRIFYYVKKADAVYILHGFRKKTRETPRKELELALKRIKEV